MRSMDLISPNSLIFPLKYTKACSSLIDVCHSESEVLTSHTPDKHLKSNCLSSNISRQPEVLNPHAKICKIVQLWRINRHYFIILESTQVLSLSVSGRIIQPHNGQWGCLKQKATKQTLCREYFCLQTAVEMKDFLCI